MVKTFGKSHKLCKTLVKSHEFYIYRYIITEYDIIFNITSKTIYIWENR